MPRRDSSAALAKVIAVLTVVVAVAVLAALLVRSYRKEDAAGARPSPPASAAPPPQAPSVPVPITPPTLTRSDLIAAAQAATDAYAKEAPPPAEEAALVGRHFRLEAPFGCAGPQATDSEAHAGWSYGTGRKTIRISVLPETWTESSFVREIGGETGFQAVEGFWVPRPWVASDDCPKRAPDPLQAAAPAASPQTLGLAEFFGKEDSRLSPRKDRAYEVILKAPDGDADPAPRGFRLVLEGRIVGFGKDQAVRCRSASPEQRPVCLIAVSFDHVSIRDPVSDATLGDWRRNS